MKNTGEMSFENADDANVPVDIWLTEVDQTDDECYKQDENGFDTTESYKFKLRASNYMPRKCRIAEDTYCVYADTREELAAILKKNVVPLYANAAKKIEAMMAGAGDNLYYWSSPK
jgi:hypothetical protein